MKDKAAAIKAGKLKARKMGGNWFVSKDSLIYFDPQPEERRAGV